MQKYIESAEFFVKNRLQSDFGDGHDFEHTLRVVRHSLWLCDQLPAANRQIVHLAALLHDVARVEESQSAGAIDHAGKGAVIAAEFLRSCQLPESLIKPIAECIAQHRYRSGVKPESLEAQILYDADKLDSLGAIGIGRAFLFAGRVGARLHNSEQEAVNNPPYGRQDTAYREYLVKLSHIPERMFTEPGRRKALELKKVMDDFFRQLNEEFFQ